MNKITNQKNLKKAMKQSPQTLHKENVITNLPAKAEIYYISTYDLQFAIAAYMITSLLFFGFGSGFPFLIISTNSV